ncbi:DUF4157 domain-containing protein [Ilyomonas limi]|nr:DUF4157 domain-containing protein [Ilyomonas limi]
MNITIKENSWRARVAARQLKGTQAAIVFNNVIHLWGISKDAFLQNRSWTRHEVAHVYQYKKYGFIRFILLYLLETAHTGYYNNRFEAEARSKEEDLSILENIQFI